MTVACPRLFEVEALRDGRLSGTELARFQSHLGVCAVCAREARALDALAAALQASTTPQADQLHARRERTRLLAAFDASLLPAARSRSLLWLAAATAAVLLVAALVFVRSPARPVAVAVRAPEPVLIRADSTAQWSRRTAHQRDEIVLKSGALSIRVDHTLTQRRLLVILPDGELEDIGTTFSVSADAGRTTRVTVQNGSVVLRLQGQPPIALGAGDSWSPALSASSAAPAAPAAPATPIASVLRDAKPGLSAVPPAPSVERLEPNPSNDFRAAMSAFNGGNHAQAATLFAAFLAAHGHDPRAEDAAYLRILALQRTGSAGLTQQAARDYLARYPRGFRHAEVETLSR